MSEGRIIAGAMSGTSADGIDIALVRIDGRGVEMSARLIHHHHHAYPMGFKSLIFRLRDSGAAAFGELARLAQSISLAYAQAFKETIAAAGEDGDGIEAIAAHGQTLFHDPPLTIQWLDPALLAAETRCSVVSDFRRADCAAGGQGAPLVPFADYILFRDAKKNRVLLNIGGIANVTFLKAGGSLKDVIAFDTGPGNCISDHLCRSMDPEGTGYDDEGLRALRGTANGGIWRKMKEDSFFNKPPPKSTDGPTMIAAFEIARRNTDTELAMEDFLAEACLITTEAIREAVAHLSNVDELIVSGGGTENRAIMRQLEQMAMRVLRSDDLGVPSAAKEAIAFALLGAATLDGLPSNVPTATGARHEVVLGSITPKPR